MDRNRIDFRIHPTHPIRVGWSRQNHLPSLPALSGLRLASPSISQTDLLQPTVGVLKPEGLSLVPEGQGAGVVLAVKAGFRKLRSDVGTGVVGAKPN